MSPVAVSVTVSPLPDHDVKELCVLGLQVCAIARLSDLLQYLAQHSADAIGAHYPQVLAYRQRYGVE